MKYCLSSSHDNFHFPVSKGKLSTVQIQSFTAQPTKRYDSALPIHLSRTCANMSKCAPSLLPYYTIKNSGLVVVFFEDCKCFHAIQLLLNTGNDQTDGFKNKGHIHIFL
uniref:Uncharacterized protein n=1 Tax=Sphaerodactylus townsendi TaxID=933632 RepID=A0ACB8FNS6_9SAUR